jgi:hypothetical protein
MNIYELAQIVFGNCSTIKQVLILLYLWFKTVWGIKLWMFLGLPNPDQLVRHMDPEPALDQSSSFNSLVERPEKCLQNKNFTHHIFLPGHLKLDTLNGFLDSYKLEC